MRAVWAEDAWVEPLCGLSIYGRNPRLVSRVSRQGRISTIAFSGFVFESVTRFTPGADWPPAHPGAWW